MSLLLGDSRYRQTLRDRLANPKLRVAQRIGALVPVTIRGETINLQCLVDEEKSVFDHATQTSQLSRIFRFPRQLYSNNQGWTWASGSPTAEIWVPGPIYRFEEGMTVQYDSKTWAIQSVENKDTKRIEFECLGIHSQIRRI